jgi:hypothetical protein
LGVVQGEFDFGEADHGGGAIAQGRFKFMLTRRAGRRNADTASRAFGGVPEDGGAGPPGRTNPV